MAVDKEAFGLSTRESNMEGRKELVYLTEIHKHSTDINENNSNSHYDTACAAIAGATHVPQQVINSVGKIVRNMNHITGVTLLKDGEVCIGIARIILEGWLSLHWNYHGNFVKGWLSLHCNYQGNS